MSANNYMLIHRIGKKYYIWENLNAEEAMVNPPLTIKNCCKSFKRLENAINWANQHDDSEYGYQVNNLCKPKDGFLEKLEI